MNIAKFFRTALAISALFVGLVHSAKAELVTYTGDTTGGPTFNRPLTDFSNLSQTGTNVAYNALTIQIDTSGEYSFVATGLGFDTMLFLYKDVFDPTAPKLNGVIGSDDLVSSNTSGFASELEAGSRYIVVFTSYYNNFAGQYALTIAGPGVITAVPEPQVWLMLGLGLAALAFTQRRRTTH